MSVRRVVTGHAPDGRAVVASDEAVEPLSLGALGGYAFYRLWAADEAPTFPDDGASRPAPAHFPPVGGFRFGLFTMPPERGGAASDASAPVDLAALEEALPGFLAHVDPDDPGMHRSATVDYVYVVSGRAVLELDDGVEVELRPGDTVVQNGTRHRWRNPFGEPCTLVIALVGAHDGSSEQS